MVKEKTKFIMYQIIIGFLIIMNISSLVRMDSVLETASVSLDLAGESVTMAEEYKIVSEECIVLADKCLITSEFYKKQYDNCIEILGDVENNN